MDSSAFSGAHSFAAPHLTWLLRLFALFFLAGGFALGMLTGWLVFAA